MRVKETDVDVAHPKVFSPASSALIPWREHLAEALGILSSRVSRSNPPDIHANSNLYFIPTAAYIIRGDI